MKKIFFIVFLILNMFLSAFAEEKVLFGAEDKENPLHIWNIELTDYWVKLSDQILKDYENINLTHHQKIMLLLKYTEKFSIGFPQNGGHPKYVIEEQKGACGTFTNVFAALIRVNGYSVRFINMYNYPTNLGHTVAEVFYEGKWHLYDTTYSAYFTTDPSNVVNPYVLSFDEIKRGDIKSHIQINNLNRYYKQGELASKFVSYDIYKYSNPSCPIGMGYKMYFPLYLDLKNKNKISKEDFNTKNQGATYIGVAGINQNHKYEISGLQEEANYSLILSPSFIGGHKELDSIVLVVSSSCDIKADKIEYFAKDQKDISIDFMATSNKCNITIETNLSDQFMKYLSLKQISLIQK